MYIEGWVFFSVNPCRFFWVALNNHNTSKTLDFLSNLDLLLALTADLRGNFSWPGHTFFSIFCNIFFYIQVLLHTHLTHFSFMVSFIIIQQGH